MLLSEPHLRPMISRRARAVGAAALVAAALVAGTLLIRDRSDLAEIFGLLTDHEQISGIVRAYGWGMVVVLLALAVVVSPIPSGPIAMAAGALYGPLAGGALTAAGAFLGALVAFGLARVLGHHPLSASTGSVARWIVRPRSQGRMMGIVFVSRLIPLISFDAVSYAAGLTCLSPWRFAVATGAGVLPAAFGFAALGAGATTEGIPVHVALALCGITLLLPGLALVLRAARRRRSRGAASVLAAQRECSNGVQAE